jgi:hypothetical protein
MEVASEGNALRGSASLWPTMSAPNSPSPANPDGSRPLYFDRTPTGAPIQLPGTAALSHGRNDFPAASYDPAAAILACLNFRADILEVSDCE